MRFTPKPENSFREFIDTYFSRCRAACPELRAVAGKWIFEDLIPGLSDFDTRFIVADGMKAVDWAMMSARVGEIHTELARSEPRWARILEHLPGVNLTASEVADPVFYYPESQLWTFYDGDPGGYLDRAALTGPYTVGTSRRGLPRHAICKFLWTISAWNRSSDQPR